MAEKLTRNDTIRMRRENTTIVATAMIAADKKAAAEKTARLRAARKSAQPARAAVSNEAPPS